MPKHIQFIIMEEERNQKIIPYIPLQHCFNQLIDYLK